MQIDCHICGQPLELFAGGYLGCVRDETGLVRPACLTPCGMSHENELTLDRGAGGDDDL